MPMSCIIQCNKQQFMQVNKTFFSEKRQGWAFIRARAFIKINTVFVGIVFLISYMLQYFLISG